MQKKERILFVDDEEPLAKLALILLESFGYDAEVFTHPLEALEAFKKSPHLFDLVITDMVMPDMTGDKLAVALMQIRPDIPVILATGYSELMDERKAHELGIKEFLLKPVQRQEFAAVIRKTLDQAKQPS